MPFPTLFLALTAALRLGAVTLALASLAGCGGGDPTDNPRELAQELVTSSGYPAALVACATPDSVDAAVAGRRSAGGAAVAARDLFPIGSMTKSMTATLAALLVQEGRIAWDSRAVDVLAASGARTEYANVTLADLLAHRGGVPTPQSLDELQPLQGSLAEQRALLSAWALRQAPASAPISTAEYSNAGYVLAAAMLERVPGEAWESLIVRRLLAPLGINARIGMAGSGGNDAAWGHAQGINGSWTPLPPEQLAAVLPAMLNPAGFVLVDAEGLGRYLQLHVRALAGRSGQRITTDTARRLHRPGLGGFALGWYAQPNTTGKVRSAHNGSDDLSYYAEMRLDPQARRACAVSVTGLRESAPAQVAAVLERLLGAR